MATFSQFGFHEVTFARVPDEVLLRVNPLVHVVQGTLQDAQSSQWRALHVKQLLPKAAVILRLWPDDSQSNSGMTPEAYINNYSMWGDSSRYYLSIDNEPGSSRTDPSELRRIVNWQTRVIQLATERKIQIAYGAFSTGNPYSGFYNELLPLFKEVERSFRVSGVKHLWRPNCYFDPKDPGHKEWHMLLPINYGWKLCRDNNVAIPPTVYGETGVAVNYDPHLGYKDGPYSGPQYANMLFDLNVPIPGAIFCWGTWRDGLRVDDDKDFITALVNRRNIQPELQWSDTMVSNTVNFPASSTFSLRIVVGDSTNIRSQPSTNASIVGKLTLAPTYYKVSSQKSGDWYAIWRGSLKGWVRQDVIRLQDILLPLEDDLGWQDVDVTPKNQRTNLRSSPFIGENIIGEIASQSSCKMHIQAVIKNEDYDWTPIIYNGVTAWVATQFITINNVNDGRETLQLNVRYFSQNDVDATYFFNDCGPACVRMAVNWHRMVNNWADVDMNIYDIASYLKMGQRDFTTIPQLSTVLSSLFGIHNEVTLTLTTNRIKSEIDIGNPVIVLVNAKHILGRQNQQNMSGHFILAVGYTELDGNIMDIIIHDPDWKAPLVNGGKYFKVPLQQFELAISETLSAGNRPNQGIYLKA